MVQVIVIQCRHCDKVFYICQSCWRGQGYCSDDCRTATTRKAHQEAQRQYRKTEKGKKAHREAEKRRRMGLTQKKRRFVDDRGTTTVYCPIKIELSTGSFRATAHTGICVSRSCQENCITRRHCGRHCIWIKIFDRVREEFYRLKHVSCHFCGSRGVLVAKFPRRGYGTQNYKL